MRDCPVPLPTEPVLLLTGASLKMFGSSANGFGSKKSDLDICLTIPRQNKVYTCLYMYVYWSHTPSAVDLQYVVYISVY